MKKKVVVLGAGLAGLSCAHRLIDQGIDVTILEREKSVGGLAASCVRGGFFYDFGPHRFHSRKEHVIRFFTDILKDNIVSVKRRSQIYIYRNFFFYPLVLSNIISCMPGSVLFKCFYDYIVAKMKSLFERDSERSFESWVKRNYGKKMYEVFFGAYTEKVLGIEPSQVSADWAEQRISIPDFFKAMVKSFMNPKNAPRTLSPAFYYPREGGIGRFAETLSEEIFRNGGNVLLGVDIKRVKSVRSKDTKGRVQSVIYECGGEEQEAPLDHLMSTIPITDFCSLVENGNTDLSMCEKIKYRSVICFYLILNFSHFTGNHWIYLPERKFFSNRISEFKNFSDYNLPGGQTMICAEITCEYNDEKWNMPEEEMRDRVLKDIEQLDIREIGPGIVLDYFRHKVKEAYPVYTVGYRDHIRVATHLLSSFRNLDCFGRNALFQYGNMDDSIEMGLIAADRYLKNHEANVHPEED